MLVTRDFALKFAKDWVNSWNAHRLDKILSHYDDNFEMNSPVIAKRLGKLDGRLVGKERVGAYWAEALRAYPELSFTLKNVFSGPHCVTLLYVGAAGDDVTETFIFDSELSVIRAYANYQ